MEQKLLKILQNCKTIRHLNQSHLQFLIHGLQNNSFVLPKLITVFSQLDSLDYTLKVFKNSQNPNLISYNTMIKCFIGKSHKATLHLYKQMKALKITPNGYTFSFLLRCFESFEALRDGMIIHGDILKMGLGSSVFVQNILLDFYAKCGNLGFALRVFEEMPDRDVVSWNSMIGAYMARREIESAIGLFELMPERNAVTWNSLLSGLSRAENMSLASSVFERMPERNEIAWNSMISGYLKMGNLDAARSIFDQMPQKTVVSWTALISGYVTIGDIESARSVFNQMPVKNVVSWNAMIAGYVHRHMFDEALSVFQEMLVDGKYKPDQTTLISVLSACSHLGSLEHGKWIDSYIKKNKLDLSVPLGNALMDMFAKCGDVENANAIFNKMANKCIITWTSMVSGLAVNGQCREALDLFDRMCLEKIKPDDVIFVTVLSACTHGGLVEEGKRVFDQMALQFDIKPRIEHYGCMVDLLGRAGRLEEAVRFIESMHLKPNDIIWASLLSSCQIHGKGDMLESITRKILDQQPSNPGYLMLLSNLSASMRRWADFSSFQVAMRQQGIEKVPGCSSIQVGNIVHEFLAKDTRHEQRKEIYGILYSLNGHLKAVFDSPMSCENFRNLITAF
ncbi:hypothetical protein QUC31_001111 [Theobroma cacao]|uniref:Pentatricopeptide repeat-containing protein At1g08070, chloroplastic n=1 Tax=Theobroma cacao TaxID=3641 RepID=A0AB32UVH5_THECC|nr:PREDICTED: pentatricopeptide repeat-containing protein At1g08070, chloroplastic [Theobroma cacao]